VVQINAQALEQLGRARLYDGLSRHEVVARVRRDESGSRHQFIGTAAVVVGHVQPRGGGRPADAVGPTAAAVDVGVGVHQRLTAGQQLLGLDATSAAGCDTVVQLLFVLRRAEPLPAERVDQSRMFFQALFQRASLLLLLLLLLLMRFATRCRRLAVVFRVVVVVVMVVTVVVVVVVDDVVVDCVYVYVGW